MIKVTRWWKSNSWRILVRFFFETFSRQRSGNLITTQRTTLTAKFWSSVVTVLMHARVAPCSPPFVQLTRLGYSIKITETIRDFKGFFIQFQKSTKAVIELQGWLGRNPEQWFKVFHRKITFLPVHLCKTILVLGPLYVANSLLSLIGPSKISNLSPRNLSPSRLGENSQD